MHRLPATGTTCPTSLIGFFSFLSKHTSSYNREKGGQVAKLILAWLDTINLQDPAPIGDNELNLASNVVEIVGCDAWDAALLQEEAQTVVERLQLARPSPSQNDAEQNCWICLEGGEDSDGVPLMRSCCCRGDFGWAHVACLSDFASQKNENTANPRHTKRILPGHFNVPWTTCSNCKQPFSGRLQLELAQKYFQKSLNVKGALFAERYIEAMRILAQALEKFDLKTSIRLYEQILKDVVLMRDRWPIENTLKAFNEMKAEMEILEYFCVVDTHYPIAVGQEALKCLCLHDGRDLRSRNKQFLSNIFGHEAFAQCKSKEHSKSQHPIEQFIAADKSEQASSYFRFEAKHARMVFGDNHRSTLNADGLLSAFLFADGEFSESLRISTSAFEKMEQYLGKNDDDTVELGRRICTIRSALQAMNMTVVADEEGSPSAVLKASLVSANPKMKGLEVHVLRYAKGKQKLIITLAGKKFKVMPDQIELFPGTPLIAKKDGETRDKKMNVQLFDAEERQYVVGSEEGNTAHIDSTLQGVFLPVAPITSSLAFLNRKIFRAEDDNQ